MSQRTKIKGFTIIELSLAMTFVAILMLSIALLTIQVSKQYTRGLTMKEVNQVGAEAASDIKKSIGAAYTGVVKSKITNIGGKPVSLLCAGSYTYVANTDASADIKYTSDGTMVRLVKIRNGGVDYCATPTAPSLTNTIISSNDPRELLSQGGDRGLTAYRFQLLSSTQSTLPGDYTQGRALYTVELTIGTGVKSEIADIINEQCVPPNDLASGGEYCAINKFTITGRVGNTYVP